MLLFSVSRFILSIKLEITKDDIIENRQDIEVDEHVYVIYWKLRYL